MANDRRDVLGRSAQIRKITVSIGNNLTTTDTIKYPHSLINFGMIVKFIIFYKGWNKSLSNILGNGFTDQ